MNTDHAARLIARLLALRFLPRDDADVRRLLVDTGFRDEVEARLAASGLRLLAQPFAAHVSVALAREQEAAVFEQNDAWQASNLGLPKDAVALLVILWALIILPKRERQLTHESTQSDTQNELFETVIPRLRRGALLLRSAAASQRRRDHAVMRILVVNPNTTQAVTDRIAAVGRAAATAGTTLDFVTAPFGPAVISSRAEDALAGHGALEAVATHYDGHDAVILGASWDTALAGLRELMPVPCVGFTESAITVATQIAERFALVTVGPRAASGHRRIVAECGLLGRLAGIGEIDIDYAAILDGPQAAVAGGRSRRTHGDRARRRRGDHSDRRGVRRTASRHRTPAPRAGARRHLVRRAARRVPRAPRADEGHGGQPFAPASAHRQRPVARARAAVRPRQQGRLTCIPPHDCCSTRAATAARSSPCPRPRAPRTPRPRTRSRTKLVAALGGIGGWKVGAASPTAEPGCSPLPAPGVVPSGHAFAKDAFRLERPRGRARVHPRARPAAARRALRRSRRARRHRERARGDRDRRLALRRHARRRCAVRGGRLRQPRRTDRRTGTHERICVSTRCVRR